MIAAFLLPAAPVLFVLLWSTGWLAARYAAPHADPLTFLALRFAIAFVCAAAIALATGAAWPKDRRAFVHAVASGIFLHAIYLGSIWWAIAQGLPAGVSGLIAAVQPILTALLAPVVVGERISARQWAGIALGTIGMVLVLLPRLTGLTQAELAPVQGIIGILPILINVVGMVSVTLGTFYQKRFIPTGDLRTLNALQYVGAFLVILPAAMLLEDMRIDWNLTVVLTMAWSVIAISLGAIGLWLLLIRHGAVSRAAALIYLMPPLVAVEAWFLFGETMNNVQIAGVLVTVVGVALAVRR